MSVATTQLCYGGTKAVTDSNTLANGHVCVPVKLYVQRQAGRLDKISKDNDLVFGQAQGCHRTPENTRCPSLYDA